MCDNSRGPPCKHQQVTMDKMKTPKDCQALSLDDSGFLHFLRVVSIDELAIPDSVSVRRIPGIDSFQLLFLYCLPFLEGSAMSSIFLAIDGCPVSARNMMEFQTCTA